MRALARRRHLWPMGTDREELRGYVDEDTKDRWVEFAAHHGLDMSQLLEAMGRHLPAPSARPSPWFRAVLVEARRVKAERRPGRRRPPD